MGKSWFTVVLFYPDYMNTGHETFVHAAEAGSRDEAEAEARRMACEANEMLVEDGLDFVCLIVFAGRPEML